MFRTASRLVVLAIAALASLISLGSPANAETSVPAISEIVVTKTADNTYSGTTTVNAGILQVNKSSGTAVIVFTGLEATPTRSADGTTSYLWTFESARVDTATPSAPNIYKEGTGTLVLPNGAAATVRVNNLANLEALLNATTDGQDLVLAAPVDPTEIGLLLPAIQKVRDAA